MNTTDFTYLLNKPDVINETQTVSLETILGDFPYFQAARSLYLKGLYNQNSFKYNQALKNTAAYTTDRSVLFDFITSENFAGLQKDLFQEKEETVLKIDIADDHSTSISTPSEDLLEKSIISSIKEANLIPEKETLEIDAESLFIDEKADLVATKKTETAVFIENSTEKFIAPSVNESNLLIDEKEITIEVVNATTEDKLEMGKPLHFDQTETHSFHEWLQLSKIKPIVRDTNSSEKAIDSSDTKKTKLDIIDKFIEANPKIPPVKKEDPLPIVASIIEDTSYLMTETLAKVYLEQKKYQKAIQAYEILILKYPEKSSFFADRITDIKILQHNN
jgi:tetratricopeptide (TPR) repeat protein